MFEKGWTVPDELRERKAALEKIAAQAEEVYTTWYNWILASDPHGEGLQKPMERLGKLLLDAGFQVEEPFIEEEETDD